MFELKWIQDKIEKSTYYFSLHGNQERKNDNLTITEFEEAILNGRIIEQCADTGREESCLVAGFIEQGKLIHIVCAEMENGLLIVTVYVPTPSKFKTIYERG